MVKDQEPYVKDKLLDVRLEHIKATASNEEGRRENTVRIYDDLSENVSYRWEGRKEEIHRE